MTIAFSALHFPKPEVKTKVFSSTFQTIISLKNFSFFSVIQSNYFSHVV